MDHRSPAYKGLEHLHRQRAKFSSNGHDSEQKRELDSLTEMFYRSILNGEPDWELFATTPYNEIMERLRGEGGTDSESSEEQNLYDLIREHLRLNGTEPDIVLRPDGSVLLSTGAAARMVGRKQRTITNYTTQGVIKAQRIEGYGNGVFISLEDIWDFADNRQPQGRPSNNTHGTGQDAQS